MMSLSTKLQLTSQGGELSYLYNQRWWYQGEGRMAWSRRAHQVEGMELPSVGEWAAASPQSLQVLNQKSKQGEGATSLTCGLPPQEGATSPRGAHLSSHMCSYLSRYSINQVPIKIILSPLTPFWLFPFNFLQPCPPLSFLFLTWLIFIELKCLFWVFESKINFEWWKSLILLK